MALLPPAFFDAVVAIGLDLNGSRQWCASGFLYYNVLGSAPTADHYYVELFLITNRHVLANLSTCILRFNPEGSDPAREFDLPLKDPTTGTDEWVAHPDPSIDVAVAGINQYFLDTNNIRYTPFRSDATIATRQKLSDLGITEGDGVFVLGFPMGLVGQARNFVIVREGCIARIRDMLAGASNEFLIDTTIFPGNSGGPVISRPEMFAMQGTQGTQPQDRSFLIGMISEYVPYEDVAISTQTGQPRVIFQENSGLASVIPIDLVQEAIEHYRQLKPIALHPSVQVPPP